MAVIEVTKNNFKTEVEQSDVPVLVDFSAEWCGPCKMIAPILDELAEELGDKAKIVKIDCDEEKELAAQFQVSSIPNLLFFKDGKVADQVAGLTSKQDLESKLSKLI